MVIQFGADAPIEAAIRADAMLHRGDLDGQAVWIRIMKAIEEPFDTDVPDKVH